MKENKDKIELGSGENIESAEIEIHLEAEKEIVRAKESKKEKSKPSGKIECMSKKAGGYFVSLLKEASWTEQVVMLISVIIIAYGVLPVVFGKTMFNIGSAAIVGIGFFFLCLSLWLRRLLNKKNASMNMLIVMVSIVASAFLIVCAWISGVMVSASTRSVPEYKTRVTVVILGCQIKNNRPSLMLQGRLDAAFDYLSKNPEAYCIVSGGKGDDEPFAEGDVMRDYLIERGISEKRIVAETRSTNTRENLQFSAEIIDKLGLYPEIIIATDRFHQYRAGREADGLGLSHYAVNRETSWYNVGHYWMREIAGIIKIWLMGEGAYGE